MTPQQRAASLAIEFCLSLERSTSKLAEMVEQAIIAAVEDEREACAMIAEAEELYDMEKLEQSTSEHSKGFWDGACTEAVIIKGKIRARSISDEQGGDNV